MRKYRVYFCIKQFILILILGTILSSAFPGFANNQDTKLDLQVYEKKELFIFPFLYNNSINTSLLSDFRKQYMADLMYYMFVTDFKRINFFAIRAEDSVQTFLNDAQTYIRKNIKQITQQRLEPDGKFKEALVTAEELLKTSDNAFVLVPTIDSIEREIIRGKKTTSYMYYFYLHVDIYSTKTRAKLNTLLINNKENILGALSSGSNVTMLNSGDLERLSVEDRKDEVSFRKAMAGLYHILQTKMKQMPQFRIKGMLSQIGHGTFGFDLGRDTSIKTDHRYKTYVTKENGKRKMTSFGKIRTVKDTYSEAQILIGKPQEGDQVEEDPKIGINVVAGYGTIPLTINIGQYENIISGSHPCILLGVEYELGPTLGLSEWYTKVNIRLAKPKLDEGNRYYSGSMSQILIDFGILKRFYFHRFALNLSGAIGYNSAIINTQYYEIKGASIGGTLNSSLEIMITPAISLYGGLNLDYYSNPSKIEEDNVEREFPSGWKWNAKGASFNIGAKVTF